MYGESWSLLHVCIREDRVGGRANVRGGLVIELIDVRGIALVGHFCIREYRMMSFRIRG